VKFEKARLPAGSVIPNREPALWHNVSNGARLNWTAQELPI
jgi:hypothetical protein